MELQFPRVISSTLRAEFNSCHKKFHFSTLMGLQRKDAQNVHLTAGSAYAAALEATRTHYALHSDYDGAVALGLEALIKSYGNYNPPDGEKKTFERTVAAFIEHLVAYPLASDPIKPSIGPNGVPRVEFTFTFEIPGCFHPVTGDPLLFSGACDELADFNGALFVLDDKTTGGIGPMWSKEWDLRSQFTGYVAGAREQHQLNVVGAIVRGMAILKEQCKTQQAIVYRPEWMIDRWKRRLTWDVQRMIQMWKDEYFPNTGEESGACTHYGLCPFHELCTTNPAFEQNFISTAYEVARWDPVKRERQK